MARTLTSGELERLRASGHRTRLYLAVLQPATVIERRLNGAPSGGDDKVVALSYDNPDGKGGNPVTDVDIGMTMYVSAEAYGAYDKGIVRIRKTPGAAIFYIGETSEIDWDDNDYLTVVREHSVWARHNYIDSDGVNYMDYDVAFSTPAENPHAYPLPVVIMGPHAVNWLHLGTKGETTIKWDAGPTYSPKHSGSASVYSWSVYPNTGASWDNSAIAAPTLTLTYTGQYLITCQVTWDYGGGHTVTNVGYRHAFVFDKDTMPASVLSLDNCVGSKDEGGWSFAVTMYDEAGLTEIRDRTLCILFARDWYGSRASDEGSIGPYQADGTNERENIVALGWVAGESIVWNPEIGSVAFEVQGPKHWLNWVGGFPSGIEDYDGTPSAWTQMEDLTPGLGLWHFLEWRTTLPRITDCYIFPDRELDGDEFTEGLGSPPGERQISVFDAPPTDLWTQIEGEAFRTVRARPLFDRFGRLFIQRYENEVIAADHTAANFPTVMVITDEDWREEITFRRIVIPAVSLVDLSGVAYADGVHNALFSISPGHVWRRYGRVERFDRLALWAGANKQTLANRLAGLVAGRLANEIPELPIPLAGNYRAFDIAPWQQALFTIESGDTERGVSPGEISLYPHRVSYMHNPTSGVLLSQVDFETESERLPAIIGDPPPEPPPISVPIPTPPLPPYVPPPPVGVGACIMSNSQIVFTMDIEAESPVWYDGDPDGDLSGNLMNVVCVGNRAYVTTAGTGGGLYYCSDVQAFQTGEIAWTCLKTREDATTECEYTLTGEFRAIDMDTSGNFCCLFHGNKDPGDEKPYCSCFYYGTDGVINGASPIDLPSVPTNGSYLYLATHNPTPAKPAVWAGGGGTFYLAVGRSRIAPLFYAPCVCSTTGGDATVVQNYVGLTKVGYLTAVSNGYVMSYQGEPPTGSYVFWGGGSFDLNAYTAVPADWRVYGATGMRHLSGAGMLSLHYGDYDLYLDNTLIGDCSAEFGGIEEGGGFCFVMDDPDVILWVLAAVGYSSVPDPVILMTEDQGTSWDDKTSNLYTVLGGNWAGGLGTNGVRCNVIAFEI